MWIIVFLSVLAFMLYLFAVKNNAYWKNKGVRCVNPLPFIGNMGLYLLGRKAFPHLLEEWYKTCPSERCIGYYMFLSPVLLIRDPELIKQIAVKDFDTFPNQKDLIPEGVEPLWSKSLIAAKDKERWRYLRTTLSPAFTSSKMKNMFELMKECAKQFSAHFQKQNVTVEVEMEEAFSRFAIDVIATTAFGVSCNSLENKENEFYTNGKLATSASIAQYLRLSMLLVCPALMKMLGLGAIPKTTKDFFVTLIKETLKVREKEGIVRPDLIHLLMEAKKGRLKHESSSTEVLESGFAAAQESEPGKAGNKEKSELTDEDITAQAFLFFLAGFDTVSMLMLFAAYELAVNPDIQQKLRNEIDSTLKNGQSEFTYDGLIGMKYLDMVISEILRKWPSIPSMGRISAKPFMIQPHLLDEKLVVLDVGTNVVFPVYPLHRDPKYYPNPEKFDPERFSDENKDSIKPFTYLPFGAGPRNCIASRFALMEAKLIIAEIVSKFEIVPIEQTQIPLQIHMSSLFVLRPKDKLWLGLKPRRSCF